MGVTERVDGVVLPSMFLDVWLTRHSASSHFDPAHLIYVIFYFNGLTQISLTLRLTHKTSLDVTFVSGVVGMNGQDHQSRYLQSLLYRKS